MPGQSSFFGDDNNVNELFISSSFTETPIGYQNLEAKSNEFIKDFEKNRIFERPCTSSMETLKKNLSDSIDAQSLSSKSLYNNNEIIKVFLKLKKN